MLELKNTPQIPTLLPLIFFISEQLENNEFQTSLFPPLQIVFQIKNPAQIVLLWLEKSQLLFQKSSSNQKLSVLLPAYFDTFSINRMDVIQLAFKMAPIIAEQLGNESLKPFESGMIPKINVAFDFVYI